MEGFRYALRRSRMGPPGKVLRDTGRLEAYGAALQQFEELLDASRAVSAASKPLLLYYALTQAGRAIVAAQDEQFPRKGGHGLVTDNDSDDTWQYRVLDLAISPKGLREFQYVSAIVDSAELPKATTLASLWRTIPELREIKIPGQGDALRPTLVSFTAPSVHWEGETSNLLDGRVVLPLSAAPSLGELERVLARYSPAPGYQIAVNPDGTPRLDDESYYDPPSTILLWEAPGDKLADRLARAEEIATSDLRHWYWSWWLIPRLPGSEPAPSRLMAWWALLYGFSILARYHPGAWSEALSLDESELAAPIEYALEAAEKAIPTLVLRALYQTHEYPSHDLDAN